MSASSHPVSQPEPPQQPRQPADSLACLEWPRLHQLLISHCLTPYGRAAWERAFLSAETRDELLPLLETHLAAVDSLRVIVTRFPLPAMADLPDCRPVLSHIQRAGDPALSEASLLSQTLFQTDRLLQFTARYADSATPATPLTHPNREALLRALPNLLETIPDSGEVVATLGRFFEPDGKLKEDATPTLAKLHQEQRAKRRHTEQFLNRLMQDSAYAGMFQGNTITERDGRMVLPVRATHKNHIGGLVHGASATGGTFFVEPEQAVTLNNALIALDGDIAREITRLLHEISLTLQPDTERLLLHLEGIAQLDRRLAGACLTRDLSAEVPQLTDAENGVPQLELIEARHPLLILQHGGQATVSNSITLGVPDTFSHERSESAATTGDTPIRTMVITGPNTGGKTVLLKMAGLLALMVRAGLPIPASGRSRLSLFDPVLAEIGDHQNIAQGLSSFSAHLSALNRFLTPGADLSRALVLIDEIAAGTDPSEGAPLATALLDALYARGATTMVTTHWSDLKLLAHDHPGYLNASVEFDIETLSPTYRLMMGIPGTSNALSIAARLGLPADLIDAARRALKQPVRDTASLIETLERKHTRLQQELDQATAYRKETQEEYEAVSRERHQLETEKRKVLSQFRTSLKSRLHVLESQVKRFKKAAQQDDPLPPDQAVDRLHHLQKNADAIFQETEDTIVSMPGLAPETLYIGQTLYSRKMAIHGEIVDLSHLATDAEVTLQAGIMRMTLPLSDLQLSPGGQAPQVSEKKNRQASAGTVSYQSAGLSSRVCDVRGQRLQDALDQVTQFLDDAVRAGYEQVEIIHGLGTGVLKQHIRGYLAESTYVQSFQAAEATDGGDGKTCVTLR